MNKLVFDQNPLLPQLIAPLLSSSQVLIWDVATGSTAGPVLNYEAQGLISQVQWSELQPEWISICYNNSLELLRVS